jgi:hypothetical protein
VKDIPMLGRRVTEILGLLMIGEGVMAALYPRRYLGLWRFGPRWMRAMVDEFTRHPEATRAIGGLEAGLGLWLATRQLEP